MDNSQKIELAHEVLNNLYDRIFDDESRMVAILTLHGKPTDATIDELGTSIRYIALSALKEKLGLRSLDDGVPSLIDGIEVKSIKRMRDLIAKYNKLDQPISDLLRPGRTI
jgi:hypothetical protein